MNRTLPSPNAKLTPAEWQLAKPPTINAGSPGALEPAGAGFSDGTASSAVDPAASFDSSVSLLGGAQRPTFIWAAFRADPVFRNVARVPLIQPKSPAESKSFSPRNKVWARPSVISSRRTWLL